MSESQLIEWHRVAIELALEAGKMMSAGVGKSREVDAKASFADLVTETDKAVENYLFGEIARRYPDHKTIGEETTSAGRQIEWTDAPTWIIDPVDGTMNFVHTNPFTCVSIGITVNRQVVIGVVYSPFLNKLYTARRGHGAFCNGQPIKVRPCSGLIEALVIAELGGDRSDQKKVAVEQNILAVAWKVHGLRCIGSAALNTCYIAEGFADAYFEFGLHCWDMAACALILTEAGGTVIDTKGGPVDIMRRRFLVASNPNLAKELSDLLPVHVEYERE